MKLVVYYDGLCQLCSREMKYFYNKPGTEEKIEFVDYTAPGFDARAEGLDPVAIDRFMHVKTPDGQIRVGVDAFIELWKRIPGYGWLARLAGSPLLNPLFRLGYYGFARVRPLLPKRKTSCPIHS
jgi:predicted DCC family thiol-disulfide oxidoreductase YuxK